MTQRSSSARSGRDKVGHLASGEHGRYTFGGLTDQGFAAISLLERGRDLDWSDVFRAPGATGEPTDAEETEPAA